MSKEVEKAARARLVLLSGDEEILRRRALTEILALSEITTEDFDFQQLDADVSAPVEWIASVGTVPFLAPRRVTVVRHLLRRDPEDLAQRELESLPESALLLLVADGEGSNEDRQTRYKRAWIKKVEDAKGEHLKFDSDPKTAKAHLQKEVAATGKQMSDAALELLVDMTAGSLSRSLDELEKLVLYVGDAPQIREADVRTVAVPSREWNVFQMVDAIIGADVPEALRQLRVLVGAATKAEEAAFRSILPQISRSLRLLWQARMCLDEGCAITQAPESIRSLWPEKPNLGKESSYRQNRTVAMAKKTSLKTLARAFEIANDTESRLKGALDGFSAIDTLERMVLEMVEALRPSENLRVASR